MINKPNNIKFKSQNESAEISKSKVYRLVYYLKKVFDDWHIDPIAGFLFPGVGDFVAAFCAVPYFYVSIVKLRSWELTLAILYNIMFDWMIGIVPFIGDLGDFFSRAYRKNYRLIVGFVENDEEIIAEVKSKAFRMIWLVLLMAILMVALALLIKWIIGLFA